MKIRFVAVVLAAGLAAAGSVSASEELAKKSGCLNCHAVATKKVGPSIKDIAANNKGKAGAEAALVAKVKAGKPHPVVKASDDDLKKVVAWMLTN